MSKKVRHFLIGVVIFLLTVAVGGNLFYKNWVIVNTPLSFPQVDGEFSIEGLDAPVEVYRDEMGIPHIYASTLHDLFMAQGYVQAQDRFWQMDAWRHIGSGTLSEMFGDAQVETDSFLRTLGWRQTAEVEYASADGDAKIMLDTYADGVNAYLTEGRTGTELSLEYGILKLINADYTPEPWTPIHSLTWGKAMAWDLRGNMGAEIERAILLNTLTAEQVEELFPPYPEDHPVIVPTIGENVALTESVSLSALQDTTTTSVLENVNANFALLDGLLGPAGAGIGSNSWVVDGSHTNTGMPILANDPHLGIQMPSIWHQIDLRCMPVSEACPYESTGFSFAGVPGVVIGHNANVAWGFTNTGPDVMDLFIEKVNPDNPNQYEVNGEWVDFETRTEIINVGGGDPVELTVRSTRHGPVISDNYGPLKNEDLEDDQEAFKDKAGLGLPENYVIALSWTALEPGSVFEAIWGFNKATNWEEFRAAAANFVVPAQNLIYADIEGNIGYQMPGRVPMRAGGNGRYPVPGWTDEFEWTGYIPFEELPYVLNPQSGFIATANNRVPPFDYEHFVTDDWAYGYRAQAIVDMLAEAPAEIDMAYMQKMQGDNKNLNAKTLVPLLGQVAFERQLAERYALLSAWDLQNDMDSAPAALFAAYWKNLLALTFHDDLPEDYYPGGGSRWFEVMRNITPDQNHFFWDDKETDEFETRDEIFAKAFEMAVEEMEDLQGKDPAKWNWGKMHTSTFENSTLGQSGIAPIENLLNRGAFPTAGGASIVNATGWDPIDGYFVNWVPSMRMIVDLSDLDNSLTVHTTGESGHVDHQHHIDMADLWRNIEYYPMYWEQDSIIGYSEAHLTLVP
ncbi:MAG: penicillin acylase family protein [Anaerolineae bacterium]|jgi:penicillin amidase|nr:penicillin acylase family protein [Anaerolineae bacterium]MBT4309158.1 penicillin acylase family protein [Anaerolineae bacterium]MBT4842555.1 penicillin acylase family protein [Anaerolineae bacterium]MBT6321926.1 penicillin acylase family protein [Anaerolineae bacterium]MBT6814635.1 penicillin acylase family protein [Anaerolineae bacterium]